MALATAAVAQESYVGIFLGASQIGYSVSSTTAVTYVGKPAHKSESTTIMSAGLLGADMKMTIKTTSWLDDSGNPLRMDCRVESAGRNQTTTALFSHGHIQIAIDNSGTKSRKTLDFPKDGRIVDDAVAAYSFDGSKVGTARTYYVFDPMTASFVKNRVTLKGKYKTTIKAKVCEATLFEVNDSRSVTNIFLDPKGDFLKSEGPMGIVMLPMKKVDALAMFSKKRDRNTTDLALTTALKPDKEIENVDTLSKVSLRLTGHDLTSLPSDEFQTVRKDAASWIVDIHPVDFASAKLTILESRHQQPEWVNPSLNMPADSTKFKELAKTIVGTTDKVEDAAKAVHSYVYQLMKPNAGIGVLRDATEVLKTKEGVCRDYAVLTGTILRAAGIPTKLVSGLVYMEGAFYYHAWVEVWDGKNWIGVDSTRPIEHFSPRYVKLAQGNVEDAFNFTLLDNVKVEVLNSGRA